MADNKSTDIDQDMFFFSGEQRVYRLKIVLKVVLLTMVFLLVSSISVNAINAIDLALFVTIVALGMLYFFVTQDTTSIITAVLLWGLTILAAYMGWSNGGLFNSSMIVFPLMIVLSIIISNKFVYIPLFLFTLLTLFFFAYADSIGLLKQVSVFDNLSYWGKAVDLAVIISFFSLSILICSNDLRKILNRLSTTNKQLVRALEISNKVIKYDQLTGLANERLCDENLSGLIENCARSGKILAFITLDLHNLRAINSTFGHAIGDHLIKQLATRLSSLPEPGDHLYRFQGNEFVMLKLCIDYQEAASMSQQILHATSQPFQIVEYEIEIAGSVGIAIAPFDGDSIELLRRKSHIALSNAKDNRSNEYQFFDEEMANQAEIKYQLIKALKKAIINQEFELYYQPKIDLSNEKIIGAEALIRWHRPGHGMVPPDVFIALAEESGLIVEITKWVINESIIACASWHQLGLQNLGVAINLSAVDFRKGNLPQIIFKALTNENLPPHYLELELTESILFDDISLIQSQIQELHGRGITIAIDDFGTGYSNLGYLSKFNITTLKIDQSFVRKLHDSEFDYHIIKAIIQMSKSLGIANVAEGIEDQATMAKLAELNCELGQGYLWSKPLANSEFIKLVQSNEQMEVMAVYTQAT